MNERELRAYLLGQATEEEAARLEGQLLGDDELFHLIESVEDDLFDDHARGHLGAADRALFEARYGPDGERQRFARALSKRADAASPIVPIHRKSVWRRWTPLAVAAALAIVLGGAFIAREVSLSPPVPVPLPTPAAAGREVVFATALATSRAAADPAVLPLPRNVAVIQLRIRLNPADRFGGYDMDLRSSPTDAQVWAARDLRASIEHGDLLVAASVPARTIPDGAYELSVRGTRRGRGGGGEELGFVSFKIVRVP